MKIALFTDTFSPQINGVTNTLDKITEYFECNNIEYKVFAPRYADEEDFHAERFYSLKFFLYPECRIALPNIFRVSQVLTDFNSRVIKNVDEFKKISDVIVANRISYEIKDVMDKVYTRDLFCRD